MCSSILYVSTFDFSSDVSAHNTCSELQSEIFTLTWGNIASTSAVIAIILFQELRRIPIKLFSKSGLSSFPPLFLTVASDTTLILSGFLVLNTEWRGRYQVLLDTFFLSSLVSFFFT